MLKNAFNSSSLHMYMRFQGEFIHISFREKNLSLLFKLAAFQVLLIKRGCRVAFSKYDEDL